MKTRIILASVLALGSVLSLGCTEVVRTPKQAHDTFNNQVNLHLAAIHACYDQSPAGKTHEKKIASVTVLLGDVLHVSPKNDQASDPQLTSCIVSVLNGSSTPIKRGDMDWGGFADGDWTFIYDPATPAVAATSQ